MLNDRLNDASFKVSKPNNIIEGSYILTPMAHNLLTIALAKIKRQHADPNLWHGEIVISAQEYADIHQVSLQDAYKGLKKSVLELQTSVIICDGYYDEEKAELSDDLANHGIYNDYVLPNRPKHNNFQRMKIHVNIVQKIAYADFGGYIYFRFSDDITYLIKQGHLEETLDYTAYEYKNTIGLTTTPAKRLYELAVKWRKLKECKKSIDEWKILFGVHNKYDEVAEFKRWVLLPAIKQINEKSEFRLTLRTQKLGRIITHFIIDIETKPNVQNDLVAIQRDPNVIDMFEGLSDKENQIIKATADKYIAEKGITDLGHRQNIYKKAKEERWGLAKLDKQTAESQAQNNKITQQIKAERSEQFKKAKERKMLENENQKFIEYFESLSSSEQATILNMVKSEVNKIPYIGQKFVKDIANSYKNVMYRQYFKKVMK